MSEEIQRPELEILMTTRTVAKYLLVSQESVRRWIRTGKVIDPAKVSRVANRIRIPRSEVVRIAGTIKTQLEDNSNINL